MEIFPVGNVGLRVLIWVDHTRDVQLFFLYLRFARDGDFFLRRFRYPGFVDQLCGSFMNDANDDRPMISGEKRGTNVCGEEASTPADGRLEEFSSQVRERDVLLLKDFPHFRFYVVDPRNPTETVA